MTVPKEITFSSYSLIHFIWPCQTRYCPCIQEMPQRIISISPIKSKPISILKQQYRHYVLILPVEYPPSIAL